jgi:hypothetical protein
MVLPVVIIIIIRIKVVIANLVFRYMCDQNSVRREFRKFHWLQPPEVGRWKKVPDEEAQQAVRLSTYGTNMSQPLLRYTVYIQHQ